MMMQLDELVDAAFSLPPNERAMLASHLLESLNQYAQPKFDMAWAVEAERRAAEIANGTVSTIPAAEVFATLRQKLFQTRQIS